MSYRIFETYKPTAQPSHTRAVALVVHGLNLKPEKMVPLISHLNAADVTCLNVSLRGHGRNHWKGAGNNAAADRLEAFKQVSYRVWKNEIRNALAEADRIREKSAIRVPLVFLGFSLGGLLGADLLVSDPSIQFDRMVLLSPALNIKPVHYAVQLLAFAPGIVIPSLSHRTYRSNTGTPVVAYNALFKGLRHFHHHMQADRLNIPTLVCIDKQDEFVSFYGLQKFIANTGLDRWSIHRVVKTRPRLGVNMHHLIIDPESVGSRPWHKMMASIVEHIVGDISA